MVVVVVDTVLMLVAMITNGIFLVFVASLFVDAVNISRVGSNKAERTTRRQPGADSDGLVAYHGGWCCTGRG